MSPSSPSFSNPMVSLLSCFSFSCFSVSAKRPQVVIMHCVQLLNCTPRGCQPVMEGLRHQLHLNDHPSRRVANCGQSPPCVRCSPRRERWGVGHVGPGKSLPPCSHPPLPAPHPGPACLAPISSLSVVLHVVAELRGPDGMGSQACLFTAKTFLCEEAEKNPRRRRMKEPKGTGTRMRSSGQTFTAPPLPARQRFCLWTPQWLVPNICPHPIIVEGACVCPGVGGSLRPRLGVRTKGERWDHPPSQPWKGRDLPASQKIGFWFIAWGEHVAKKNCVKCNKYWHKPYKVCELVPGSQAMRSEQISETNSLLRIAG